ncbi:HNH endonuclease [Salmonella enterica subsp. enterica serovar Teko]|nr:HNH endonuclease [Salmonella enterica subsp. enterica serovar Teko]
MSKNDISYEYLISNIHYDKETGIFKKIIKSNNGDIIGFKPTGCTHSMGYIRIYINKKWYLAHRLAWLYVTGKWPINVIDHTNRNKADNRFINLRDVSSRENNSNTSRNKGTEIGTERYAYGWRAYIGVNGKLHHLGSYATCDGAKYAYALAKYQVEIYGYLRPTPIDCRKLNYGNRGNRNGNPKSNRRKHPSVNENKYLNAMLRSGKK